MSSMEEERACRYHRWFVAFLFTMTLCNVSFFGFSWAKPIFFRVKTNRQPSIFASVRYLDLGITLQNFKPVISSNSAVLKVFFLLLRVAWLENFLDVNYDICNLARVVYISDIWNYLALGFILLYCLQYLKTFLVCTFYLSSRALFQCAWVGYAR